MWFDGGGIALYNIYTALGTYYKIFLFRWMNIYENVVSGTAAITFSSDINV